MQMDMYKNVLIFIWKWQLVVTGRHQLNYGNIMGLGYLRSDQERTGVEWMWIENKNEQPKEKSILR